jgi:MoaA/NifB/PqqE/SkfB family radical SAM enzyme
VIRKIYRDFIIQRLRQEGVGWLARRANQYLRLHLAPHLGRPLCGPIHGTIIVTYRCNYDCVMCDMPEKCARKQSAGVSELSTERFRALIGEFARLGTPGLGFTGGEPLMRADIYDLLACTRQHGMITHLNTNGYFMDDAAAGRIVAIGVDSVNISLDGACPETHDRIRNHAGAFERATTAVGRLRRLRRGSLPRIKNVAVIDETTIDEVPDMIRLSRDIGADCIEFIPRQPLSDVDHARAGSAPVDENLLLRVDRMVEQIRNAARDGFCIENSPAHLRLFRSSFAGIPSPVRCRAGYNSLAVDCYGDVFPCFPWGCWGKTAGNVREGSLVELWNSPAYQICRSEVSACRDCYLNGQIELNLLFDLQGRLKSWLQNS